MGNQDHSSSRDLSHAVGVKLKPSDVLAKAADLIEPPGAWTQGSFARDECGEERSPYGPWATCFCIRGAVRHVVGAPPESRIDWFLRDAVGWPVIKWNDAPGRTQAEVVAALRKASDLAREAGQ